jgi:hypothetical protein
MPRRNILFGSMSLWEKVEIGDQEEAAEEFAKKEFLRWKQSRQK